MELDEGMRNSTRIRVVDLVSELDELRNACTEHVLHIAARYLRFVLCGSWFDVDGYFGVHVCAPQLCFTIC